MRFLPAMAISRRRVGLLSCSRTAVYAPGANDPEALAVERPVSAGQDWEGKKVAFLNILRGCWCGDRLRQNE
jgi:hypothetical protein